MNVAQEGSWSGRLAAPVAKARAMVRRKSDEPVDHILAAAVIALIGFGVVMVYSASAFDATVRVHDPQFYVRRQAMYGVAALVAMWVASRLDYRSLRRFTYPILGTTALLLLATVVGFGHKAGNAYRWLPVGPIHVQPSEVAKVALVLWLAHSLSKKAERVRSFTVGLLPHLLIVGILMLLCLRQPDFGSAAVLAFITGALLFIAGGRIFHLLTCLAFGVVGAIVLVKLSPYRMARWMAFSNMDAHRQSLAYQPFQSVMSFGSGGLFGNGLGRGYQVLYLPEAHTDFISAIIGEEFGFVGIVALLGTYTLVVWRGIKVALEADDDYGSFIAFGISILLGTQVLLNLAVAMAIMPTKGLTLPFISYGGSSLLVSAASMGVLLSISRRRASAAAARASLEPSEPPPSASAVVATAAEDGA